MRATRTAHLPQRGISRIHRTVDRAPRPWAVDGVSLSWVSTVEAVGVAVNFLLLEEI